MLQIRESGGYRRDNAIYLAFYLTISLCEANCEHSRRSAELVSLEPQRRRAKPTTKKTKVSRGSQATGVADLSGPVWQSFAPGWRQSADFHLAGLR